ncbi:Beta-lactamase domain-containing protein [Durusdinium trenchii]|uniref:Beta-lactamase domain-containing protein n=1 Tax=Durusdinium trenchii TaxID=1381693 RepID=A0ABP0QR37_9DINO
MGMLGLLCGRKVVDHLKPAGSGVILPLKIWDRSLKFFHPDAGIVGTGADFVEWLKIMTNNGKGNDARQIFSQRAAQTQNKKKQNLCCFGPFGPSNLHFMHSD